MNINIIKYGDGLSILGATQLQRTVVSFSGSCHVRVNTLNHSLYESNTITTKVMLTRYQSISFRSPFFCWEMKKMNFTQCFRIHFFSKEMCSEKILISIRQKCFFLKWSFATGSTKISGLDNQNKPGISSKMGQQP